MRKVISFVTSELGRIIFGLIFFIPAFICDYFGIKILPLVLYIAALVIAGASVFVDAVRGILRRDLLDEKFLMSIASVGAMLSERRARVLRLCFFSLLESILSIKQLQNQESQYAR